jgi:hypothetical protein
LLSTVKNAVAFYKAGVVAVNLKVVGLAPGTKKLGFVWIGRAGKGGSRDSETGCSSLDQNWNGGMRDREIERCFLTAA